MTTTRHRVAILPWGNVIDDFLGTVGSDLRRFALEMSGGWLFGYADALRAAGADAVIVCASRSVRRPTRLTNPRSGLVTVALPVPAAFRAGSRLVGDGDVSPGSGTSLVAQELVGRLSMAPNALASVLREEGCTAVLTQEYEHPRLAVANAAARQLGIPSIATFQGGYPSANPVVQRARRGVIDRADGFVIGAGGEAARVARGYGVAAARIARVPNPLDLSAWRPADRAASRRELGLPSTARIAICHTRVDYRRKGLDLLLAAWRSLVARRPDEDLRLHLVGSGADDEVLAADIARAPVPGLRWVRAYVSDRDAVRRELGAADVYVLASRHEGFPVAPLEAMACGLPVVLADAPGARDILPEGPADGGWVVPKGSAAVLADALDAFFDHDAHAARELGLAARERVAAFASTQAVGEALAAFVSDRADASGR